MLKFTLSYLVYMIFFYLLFIYQEFLDLQTIYTNTLNVLAVSLINFIGIEAVHWGIDIILPRATLRVAFGCNGLEAILIFSAGVLAFKALKEEKKRWLLKGILYLTIFNLIRVVALAYTLVFYEEYFLFMHDYITQDIMIFLAIVMFLLFTNSTKEMNTLRKKYEEK